MTKIDGNRAIDLATRESAETKRVFRVTLQRWKKRWTLNCREWYWRKGDGKLYPTRRGLSLGKGLPELTTLAALMLEAATEAYARGLLEPHDFLAAGLPVPELNDNETE
jgi:hypothetical protein